MLSFSLPSLINCLLKSCIYTLVKALLPSTLLSSTSSLSQALHSKQLSSHHIAIASHCRPIPSICHSNTAASAGTNCHALNHISFSNSTLLAYSLKMWIAAIVTRALLFLGRKLSPNTDTSVGFTRDPDNPNARYELEPPRPWP